MKGAKAEKNQRFHLAAGMSQAGIGGCIQLYSNRRAVIEGSSGVLEYGPEVVRIRLGKRCVRFTGRSLRIRCMTENSMIVEGFFTGLEYLV